jgi:hypothetical protein
MFTQMFGKHVSTQFHLSLPHKVYDGAWAGITSHLGFLSCVFYLCPGTDYRVSNNFRHRTILSCSSLIKYFIFYWITSVYFWPQYHGKYICDYVWFI